MTRYTASGAIIHPATYVYSTEEHAMPKFENRAWVKTVRDDKWKRCDIQPMEPVKRKGLLAHLLQALRKRKGAGLVYMERNVP